MILERYLFSNAISKSSCRLCMTFYSQPFRKQFPKPVRKSRLFCYNYLVSKTSTFQTSISPSISPFGTPNLHKTCTTSAKIVKTTQKQPPFRLQRAVVMFSLFVSLFKLMLPQKRPYRVRRWGTRSSRKPLPKACREQFPGWALQLLGRIHIHKGKRIFSYQ